VRNRDPWSHFTRSSQGTFRNDKFLLCALAARLENFVLAVSCRAVAEVDPRNSDQTIKVLKRPCSVSTDGVTDMTKSRKKFMLPFQGPGLPWRGHCGSSDGAGAGDEAARVHRTRIYGCEEAGSRQTVARSLFARARALLGDGEET